MLLVKECSSQCIVGDSGVSLPCVLPAFVWRLPRLVHSAPSSFIVSVWVTQRRGQHFNSRRTQETEGKDDNDGLFFQSWGAAEAQSQSHRGVQSQHSFSSGVAVCFGFFEQREKIKTLLFVSPLTANWILYTVHFLEKEVRKKERKFIKPGSTIKRMWVSKEQTPKHMPY